MRSAIAAALLFLLAGCGNFERSNPFDPAGGRPVEIGDLLIGTWSREDSEKNEVYTFKRDGRVELRDYSSPGGGEVDRDAPFPQTLVVVYSGTYTLIGNLLRISFTDVQINDPEGLPPSLPPSDKVVEIEVTADRLVMREWDGDRIYTRM